jgi:type IV pilus assembly protein PilY1
MLKNLWIVAPAALAMLSGSAGAQTLAEDFTLATNPNNWTNTGSPGACLTAGTAANNSTVVARGSANYSSIKGCNLATPDASGSGALRLTNATTNQNGAIVWNDTFPTNKGLQVTFTTRTYGGSGGDIGADGMSFFLMDGAKAPNIGAFGGSLGYSCSNVNGDGNGLNGGYIGLGIDEYGNFLNSGDNTASAIARNTAINTYGSNPSFQANRIGLRGAGSINWTALNALDSTLYRSTYSNADKITMVKATCRTGKLQERLNNGTIQTKVPNVTVMDYPAIAGGTRVLPSTQPIARTGAGTTRAMAVPITYRLMITPAGLLNFMYSYNGAAYQEVLSNHPITVGNGPLPASFRFGFAGATGGSTNIHEIACFVAEPTESTSSAGANTVQAGQVRTGTQVYLASFNPNNWTGSLVSAALTTTQAGGVSIAGNYNWDLNCKLTGGGCSSMGTTNGVPNNTVTVQAPADRKIITVSGGAGVPLQWGSLSDAQKAILTSTDTATIGQNRLNWLRGTRSQEQTAAPAGPLRARGGVLGDIINSSPTWVGAPSMNYGTNFRSALYGTTGSESSYTTFQTTMATRTHVVYAGSNDGFLHGARAGANNSSGAYVSTNNDGHEMIAFMPPSVLASAKVATLTRPTYGHEYFVDAAPGTGDVYYGGAWHTWLVGGMGPGGKEIYALDVTDPSGAVTAGVGFSETNAAAIVKGTWNTSALAELGFTYGTPLVRRMHNGQWAIIFGNGLDSANHLGGIYIGLLDATTGAVTFSWYSTGVGSADAKNGITNVASGDLDGDHIVDYLYAGDLQGNVWRFDVTSTNTSDWGVSTYGGNGATPLFSARNPSGGVQPITTKIAAASVLTGGNRRVVLGFGTGKSVPFSGTTGTTYASGVQTVYGIWDWDMTAWNNGRTTDRGVVIPGSTSDFAAAARPASPRTFGRSNLLENTLAASSTTAFRELDITRVCWEGTTTCTTGNNKYGWRFDLPSTNEQLIYNPVFTDGVLALNTAIPPAAEQVGQCTPSLPTGWTMAFKMDSGGGAPQNIFVDNSGSLIVGAGHKSISGRKDNAVGTPYVVTVGSKRYFINQTRDGDPVAPQFNPQGGVTVKRVSLEQLR